MTFDEFRIKWNGKGIDFDGAYGDQCMDLMHQYITEVCGLTDGRILAAPEAKAVYQGYPNTFGSQYFDKIDNTPTGVPQKGDIIFWKEPFGKYTDDQGKVKYAGHVAIFVSGDANKFTSFDQNFGHAYCEPINHANYDGVIGWLRFKGTPVTTGPEMYNGYDLTNKESMKVAVDVMVRVQKGEFVDKSKYDADLKSKQTTIDNLNNQVGKLQSESTGKDTTISTLTSQVSDLTKEVERLSNQSNSNSETQKLYEQMQQDYTADKLAWAEATKKFNYEIAAYKNTSYKTIRTSTLLSEVVRRTFHING